MNRHLDPYNSLSRTRTALPIPALILSLIVTALPAGSPLAATPPAPPAALANDPASEYYEDALMRFNRGDFRGAFVQLKNVLQEKPGHLPARILLARVYLAEGYALGAEEELRRVRSMGADDSTVLVPLGQAYLMQRKYESVLSDIPAEGHAPRVQAELLAQRAQAHLELRQLEDAEAAYDKAYALAPHLSGALVGKARIAMVSGRFDDAATYIGQALAIDSENPQAWFVQGDIRRMRGDLAGALESFDQVIARNPDYGVARTARVATLIALGRDEEARAELEVVRAKMPFDPHGSYLQALLLERAGKREQARQAYDTAVQHLGELTDAFVSSHSPTLLLAGLIHAKRGELEQAERYLRSYLKREPVDSEARRVLAALLLEKREPNSAVAVLEPVIRAAPEDPRAYALMGEANLQMARPARAVSLFEKAVSLAPTDVAVRTRLARAHMDTGDRERALAEVQAALTIAPHSIELKRLSARLLIKNGRAKAALETTRGLLALDANSPDHHVLAGQAVLLTGNVAGAREHFEQALALSPGNVEAELNLGSVEVLEGNPEQAIARFDRLLTHNPDSARIMSAMAAAEEKRGNLEAAIRWRHKALAVDPDDTASRLSLVDLQIRTGQPEEARKLARALVDEHRDYLPAMAALARSELALNHPERAIAIYGRMSRIAGYSSRDLLGVAQLQIQVGDDEGAYWTLRKAITAEPELPHGHLALARLDLKAGEIERAVERAEQLQSRHPDSKAVDMLVGDVLLRAGRFEDALEAYQKAAGHGPDPEVALRLYRLRTAMGQEEQARRELAQWVSEHPSHTVTQRALARAYRSAGQNAQAMEHYAKVLELDPSDVVALNSLATLHLQAGSQRALHYARSAYAVAPEHPGVLDTLGWIHVELGQPEAGLGYLREAFARETNRPEIRYHLAVALNRLGRHREARHELEIILQEKHEFVEREAAEALWIELSGG